jgi:hypothetical protein
MQQPSLPPATDGLRLLSRRATYKAFSSSSSGHTSRMIAIACLRLSLSVGGVMTGWFEKQISSPMVGLGGFNDLSR